MKKYQRIRAEVSLDAIAHNFLSLIHIQKKGLDVSSLTGVDFAAFKETQYDILADTLRRHLDMKKIYEILEQGI